MDRYLGGRLATSLHTGQYMEKLRFVHKASVERPFANDSTTLEFCGRSGTELYLLKTIELQDDRTNLHARNAPSTVRSSVNPRFSHLR